MNRIYCLAIFVFVGILIFVGCSGKGSRSPISSGNPSNGDSSTPADSQLQEPTLAVIRHTSGAPSGVRVRWPASNQDGIAGYNIYRANQSFTDLTTAQRVNPAIVEVPVSTIGEYDDLFNCQIGDTFHYRLTSVDGEGDESLPSPEMVITISSHYVTQLSSLTGGSGDVITITGANFGNYDATTDKVFFRGLGWGAASSVRNGSAFDDRDASAVATITFNEAEVVSWTNTSIDVIVPLNTTEGTVRVRTGGTNADFDGIFTCTDPYMLRATPDPISQFNVLTIEGNNFGASRGTSSALFGGLTLNQAADFLSWTNRQIELIVPYALIAGNHKLEIMVSGKLTTNAFMIRVTNLGDPVITSVNPLAAGAGDTVTITGLNFAAYDQANNFVELIGITGQGEPPAPKLPSALSLEGIVRAPIVSWANTQIQIAVPPYITTGEVKVIRGTKVARFTGPFTSTDPYILSVLNDPVTSGEMITIRGNNFGDARGNNYVSVGSTQIGADGQYVQWTNTMIQCFTPNGEVGNQPVRAYVNGLQSNQLTMLLTPALAATITDVSPQKQSVGRKVTITGENLGVNPGTVTFNGIVMNGTAVPPDPNILSWSTTQVEINVPVGAELTGNTSVTTSDGRATNQWFYRIGIPQGPSFIDDNFIFAGEMSGAGSTSVNDGTYTHFFSYFRNKNEIQHIRIEDATGFTEELVVTTDYNALSTNLAAAFDGADLWLAFVSDGKIQLISSSDYGNVWNFPAEEVTDVPHEIGSLSIADIPGSVELAWGDMTDGNVYHARYNVLLPAWEQTLITNEYAGGLVDIAIKPPAAGGTVMISTYALGKDSLTVFAERTGGGWGVHIGAVGAGGLANSLVFRGPNSEPCVVFNEPTGAMTLAAELTSDPGKWTTTLLPTGLNLCNGLDVVDDGVDTLYIATGSYDAAPDAWMLAHNYATGFTDNSIMLDVNYSYSPVPAIEIDTNGNVMSLHTDQTSWDHWLVEWDLSGSDLHTSMNYGDGFGDIVPLDGDDNIVLDLDDGAGFIFRDDSYTFLYFGYYNDGVKDAVQIDTGLSGDFTVGAVEFDGTLFHVFYNKAGSLIHRTINASTMGFSTESDLGTFGGVIVNDVAVIAGRDGMSLMNALYINTNPTLGTESLVLCRLPSTELAWQVNQIVDLGSANTDGLDIAINPVDETPVVTYYDGAANQMMVGTFDGADWSFGAAAVATNAGRKLVCEFENGYGLEAIGFDQVANNLDELLERTPNWTQNTLRDQMTRTSTFDLWGGALPFSSGEEWGLVTIYYCTTFPDFSTVINKHDSLTIAPVNLPNAPAAINYLTHSVNSDGGISAIYSQGNDHGLYLMRYSLLIP